jgi:DNA-binding CsgD family transcriptional regulator
MSDTALLHDTVPGPLVGRNAELRQIGQLLERAGRGGGVLLVLGEPGAGKTALLDAAAGQAITAGFRVLRGSGVQLEADVPFSGLHQLLAPLADDFEMLTGPHRAALEVALGFANGPAPDRLLIGNATLTLVRAMSAARPLLFVVDDLHWVDPATAAVLGFLARRFDGVASGLLAAIRDDAGWQFETAGLPALELGPLDERTADGLMRSRFPALTAHARRWLLAEARGNPLALLELPRALAERGALAPAGLPPVIPLNRRLQRVYAPTLAGIPQRSREALLMMALGGARDARVLRALADGPQGLADLVPAERARLVDTERGPTRPAFRHPLVRSAVVELATAHERRQAHQRLAELMSDEPDLAAWHRGAAAAEPDEEVAAELERAALLIRSRGHGAAAVSALIRAAELSPAAPDHAGRLAEAAYLAASLSGDLGHAEALLDDARQSDAGHSAGAAIAIVAAFLLLAGDGDVDAAGRQLQHALASAGPADARPLIAECASESAALACTFGSDPERCATLRQQLDRLAHELRPRPGRCPGQPPAPQIPSRSALAVFDAEVAALARRTDPAGIIQVAARATFIDRLPACRPALRRLSRAEPDSGFPTSVIRANTLLAYAAYHAGQWGEAELLADRAAEAAAARGCGLMHWHARAVTALVAACRGATADARALADQITRWSAPRSVRYLLSAARHTQALAALGESDFGAAYQHASAVAATGLLGSHAPHGAWVALDLVEAALRTGRTDEAIAHVRALQAADVAAISPRMQLLATATAAMTAADEDAFGGFEKALAVPGADRWPFDLGRVHLLYGERLRRVGRMAQSREHFTAALDTFGRLGAPTWMERAAQELRATGQTRQRAEGWQVDALTPQELEIASLAAAGLSNKAIGGRLYLSHRTVGAHLYRIFPKLGVTSRAALRDALPAQPAG